MGCTEETGKDNRYVSIGTATHARRSADLLDRFDDLIGDLTEVIDQLVDLDEATQFGEHGTPDNDFRGIAARRCGVTSSRLAHCDDRLAVRAATELIATDGHRYDAVSTTARWIEQHLGVRRPEAQRIVRVARTIEKLPDLAFPFASGQIRLAHIDAIARIVPARMRGDELAAMWDALAGCQRDLVDAATSSPIREFEHFCGRVRDRLDVDGPASRAAAPSRVWLNRTFDGRWALTGDLTDDDGSLLAAYLEQRTHRNLHAESSENRKAEDGAEDAEPVVMSEVRAGALLDLCRDGTAAGAPGRVALNLHIDLEELSPGGNPARAWTGVGTDITEDTLWALLSGATVRPVFCEGGRPLSYGRSRRLAPHLLKSILSYRNRHCAVGTCDAPHPWLHNHHTEHWEDGGTTDPANSTPACPPHHRGHHAGKWQITRNDETDDIETWRPDSSLIDKQPHWATHPPNANADLAAIRARVAALTRLRAA